MVKDTNAYHKAVGFDMVDFLQKLDVREVAYICPILSVHPSVQICTYMYSVNHAA